jgi:hypothetical protein
LLPNLVLLKSSLLIALCLCFVFTDGCTKRDHRFTELKFTEEISPQPPRVGPVTLTLRLTDLSGAPVNGAQLTLEANMSHAGMVPVFADASEIEPGRYRSILKLSMAGDWTVIVHVNLPGNRKETYNFEIRGVEPPVSAG